MRFEISTCMSYHVRTLLMCLILAWLLLFIGRQCAEVEVPKANRRALCSVNLVGACKRRAGASQVRSVVRANMRMPRLAGILKHGEPMREE